MPETTSRLLDLSWELRRAILLRVLDYSCIPTPIFDEALIRSRVRLRNCFDENFPEQTNFYVSRNKNQHLHEHGLLTTNHQLREETSQLIEELKSTSIDASFVLDVMLVKDIGVFPSWVSFPYRPEHLKKLTVNIRIIRPGTSPIPNEWIELARYAEDKYYPTIWHMLMVITLYAFGCFSVKQDSHVPRIQNNRHLTVMERSASTKEGKVIDTQPTLFKSESSDINMQSNLADHHSDVVDAYRLSSASWVTDDLHISFDRFEYDINNNSLCLASECNIIMFQGRPSLSTTDSYDDQFYKAGYIQFGRDIFRRRGSPLTEWIQTSDPDNAIDARESISQGTFASYQLQDLLTEVIGAVASPRSYQLTHAPYLQILSHSVGVINHSGPMLLESPLMTREPTFWVCDAFDSVEDLQDGEWHYSDKFIERSLARETARDPQGDEQWKWSILKSRKAHGWILKGD